MSLALYRRYRPESFADVVGQGHVTEPLMQALRTGRVNHAYLFSGPRGCGKTTSARILARCLNCEQGPTPTPCGSCPSCRDLARGGPGSLDVIEIDAASHGGVDDARDLRDRVAMAPVRDRFRVYIIDEAHMVSTQGFNALLKVVEEPPEHVKFVFATTEPDKVLQTIRSRTHHYAFRLVPPDVLVGYLGDLCESERVPVGQGVLPLVVRAGQGSVRDSLSVLDQLIAGAGATGLDYTGAVALLGYTDDALLDDIVGALAEADGAALFEVVHRVVESGHDPRRFVEDLLERLRDLILVQAMGAAADGVLRAVPPDQLDRMRAQAARLGAAELSRDADIANAALAEMVGASSPRIHLELLCARLLLPAADDAARGVASRVDRLERRLGDAPIPSVPSAGPGGPSPTGATPGRPWREQAAEPRPTPPAEDDGASGRRGDQRTAAQAPVRPGGAGRPEAEPRPEHGGTRPDRPASRDRSAHTGDRTSAQGSGQQDRPAEVPPGAVDTERMRRSWPEVLGVIQQRRRATWMILSTGAGVHELTDGVLRISFANQGTARGFANGQHANVVAEAVHELFNLTVRVEPYLGPTGPSPSAAPAPNAGPQGRGEPRDRPDRAAPPRSQQAAPRPGRSDPRGASGPQSGGGPGAGGAASPSPAATQWPDPVRPPSPSPSVPAAGPAPAQAAAAATGPTSAPGRAVSTTDAWGVPFGDEPPPEDAPPDDAEQGAPSRASGRHEAPAPPPRTDPAVTESPAGPAPAAATPRPAAESEVTPAAEPPHPAADPPKRLSRIERMQREQLAAAGQGGAQDGSARPVEDDLPSVDDPDAEDSGQVGPAVVERLLGGKVIDIQEL